MTDKFLYPEPRHANRKHITLCNMNIRNKLHRLSFLVVIAALVIGQASRATAAVNDQLGEHAGTVPVPAGLSKSQVQDDIVMVLSSREWGIKEKTDDQVVGYLKHRSSEATVTLVYDTTKVDLFCVGWKIDKSTGVREKPEQPTGWLKNIKADLTKIFNKAATQK